MRDVSKHFIMEGQENDELSVDLLNEQIGAIAEEVEQQEQLSFEEVDEFDDLIVADEEIAQSIHGQ